MKELFSATVIQLYTNYLEFCSTALLTTGCFWLSHIELVQILLNLTRATQTRNWNLHLACTKDFYLGALLTIIRTMLDTCLFIGVTW